MNIVWSSITRWLHWSFAGSILIAYMAEEGDLLHNSAGYLALAVTVARIGWGLKAKDMANFKYFPLSRRSVMNHAADFIHHKKNEYPGHNPFASWTYVFMWILVSGLGVTGYLLGTDAFWGSEAMEGTHKFMAQALFFLIVLHFLGLGIDSIKYKRKTWMGMINGRR